MYHTEHDTADRIPVETLQRVGDNVLEVVLAIAGRVSKGFRVKISFR